MTLIKTSAKEDYIDYCWSAAKDYCNGVLDGSIITNENIRLAVQRHINDLERSDLDWRPEAVERVFKFFSYLYVGDNKQFTLQPFQAFIILALFGLYFKDTDIRKYTYAFLFIGRKNGKTTFAAALQLYFMMADGQSFPRSLLISASQKNAKDTSFAALEEIISCSAAIHKRVIARRSNRVEFRNPEKLGWCQTTVMDMDRLEGYNPTSCILDEIHTYKDAQKFNVIRNGLGTKLNPMLFLISTGGYGKDSFCVQLVETGRNVLRGLAEDDRFFFLLYELDEGDEWQDDRNWMKVNPGLGTIIDKKMFYDNYITSKNIPRSLEDFLTKRLNMFLDENSSWIKEEFLNNMFVPINEDELKELPCYIGVDLSRTRDLTSVVCLWDAGDKFYAKAYFYFVKDENNNLRKGNIDINNWIKNSYVIPCDTPTIDYDLVKEKIIDINNNNNVVGLYYDPWHFDRLLNDMKYEGIWCVPITPGVRNFDGAIRFIEEIIYANKMNIYINKCMHWNFRNVVLFRDMNGNIRPDKNKSADAIDGVIALLNAVAGYLRQNVDKNVIFLKNI